MPRTTASPSGTTSRNLCSPMAGGLALTTWSYTLYPGCFGAAGAPVPGSGLAGVMLSMTIPSLPLTVPRVPLTTYVPVSPLENLASVSATEASALSEALSSYRLPSTSNCGRWCVPDASAAPVKVSPSAACNPTAEPTSATSATETIDNLFTLPPLPMWDSTRKVVSKILTRCAMATRIPLDSQNHFAHTRPPKPPNDPPQQRRPRRKPLNLRNQHR